MDSIFRVASEVATPISLASLSIIVFSTILSLALKKTGRSSSQKTVEKIVFYAFVIGIIMGVGGLASYTLTNILPSFLNQNIRIAGVVIDADSGEPITYADVNLVGGGSVETNTSGVFEIVTPRSWMSSNYQILVHDQEYEPGAATASTNNTTGIVIKLKKIPVNGNLLNKVEKVALSHFLGLPVIHIQYSMINGNKSVVYARNTSIALSKRGGRRFLLNHVSTGSVIPNTAWAESGIRIRPGQVVSVTSEYLFQDAPLADINAKIIANSPFRAPIPPVLQPIFSSEFVEELHTFTEKNFGWSAGEWELIISISSDAGLESSPISFSIDENDISVLRAVIEDYRYGYGIISHLRFAGPNKGYIDALAKNL